MKQLIKNWLAPKRLLFLAEGYTIALTILLLLPSQDLPSVSFDNLDKVLHILLTMVLAIVWLSYAYIKYEPSFSWRMVLMIAVSVFFYGIIIEILQSELIQTRSGDIFDVIANTIGLLTGILVFYKLRKFYLKT